MAQMDGAVSYCFWDMLKKKYRPARVSEYFHGGENDVYIHSRYLNRPAQDSEDFHDG